MEGKGPYCDTNANCETHGHDELVAATVQVDAPSESNSRGQDIGKQEDSHSSQDTVRNARNDSCNLTENSQQNQPEPTCIPSATSRTLGQGNHTVVLGECGVWQGCAQTRQDGTDGISKQATLNTFSVFLAFHIEI